MADLCEGVPPHSTLAKEFRLAQPSKGGRRLPRRGPLGPQRQDSEKRGAPLVKRQSTDVTPRGRGRDRPVTPYGPEWGEIQPASSERRRDPTILADIVNSEHSDVRHTGT